MTNDIKVLMYILTKTSPTILIAPPRRAPLLFVKFIVPFILTLALLIFMHPPTFESNWLIPKKVNGKRTVVITLLMPNRKKLDLESSSFLFSLNWLTKLHSKN